MSLTGQKFLIGWKKQNTVIDKLRGFFFTEEPFSFGFITYLLKNKYVNIWGFKVKCKM